MAGRRGKGEGAIYRHGDRWRAVVDLGWENGRRKRKYLSGKTRAAVAAKLRVAQAQAESGTLPIGPAPTVERWMTEWLESVSTRVAPRTLAHYRRMTSYYIVPALGRKRLDALRPTDFTRMTKGLNEKGLSLRTMQAAHQVLGMALRQAVRQGVIPSNPADLVDAPAPRKEPLDVVSPAEARTLLAAAQDVSYGPLWTLALTTGMREGEILALRWRDVDLDAGIVHVRHGKTRAARRAVPLTEVARQSLSAVAGARKPEDLVFSTRNGTPISPRNLLRAWHAFSQQVLGRRLSFHALRHSAATLMLGQGVGLRTVSDVLGHANIRITSDTYVEVLDNLKVEAARHMDDLFRP
ncbi:MAG: tyrosine-type recombinase/integrase [Actinomycetota bacterium]